MQDSNTRSRTAHGDHFSSALYSVLCSITPSPTTSPLPVGSSGRNNVTRLCGCDRKKAPGAKTLLCLVQRDFFLSSLFLPLSITPDAYRRASSLINPWKRVVFIYSYLSIRIVCSDFLLFNLVVFFSLPPLPPSVSICVRYPVSPFSSTAYLVTMGLLSRFLRIPRPEVCGIFVFP